MRFRILHQDAELVAVDKPAGFHTHPPEDPQHPISRTVNSLHLLSQQLGRYLYPVHRLDRATSGVLLYALTADAASELTRQFREREARKTYLCVTRGWTDAQVTVDHPLDEKDARSSVSVLARIELPEAVGRYPTSRYALCSVHPETGRMHQIRRHLAHIAHPLVGDSLYGDSGHNRLFRQKLGMPGLWLRAYSLEIRHPRTHMPLRIRAPWKGSWHRMFDLFGVCAWVP